MKEPAVNCHIGTFSLQQFSVELFRAFGALKLSMMGILYQNRPLGKFCSVKTFQLHHVNLDNLLDTLYRDLGMTQQQQQQQQQRTTGSDLSHVTGSSGDPARLLEEGAGDQVPALYQMAPPPLEVEAPSRDAPSSSYSTLNSHDAPRSNYSTLTSTDMDFFSADDMDHVSTFQLFIILL